ncbi:hypothetical protein FRC02_011383 [Tulasnella sp. 418]|nr:hypothetical protein FRC02_011383 [Tulasnella sp. 418]
MADGAKKNANDSGAVSASSVVVSNGTLSSGNGGFVESSVVKVQPGLKNGSSVVIPQSQVQSSINGAVGAANGQSYAKKPPAPLDLQLSSQSYYRQRTSIATPSPAPPSAAQKTTPLPTSQVTGASKPNAATSSSQSRDAARTAEIKRLLSRKRQRTEDDNKTENDNRQRFQKALALDYELVQRPDIETPFEDAADAVRRLLPYHIFQHPQDELKYALEKGTGQTRSSGKGKEKECSTEGADNETKETGIALFRKQKHALESRFREIRIREAKHSSPPEQMYWLTQATLDSDREANTELSNKLREARVEHERKEREKQSATQASKSSSAATTPITSRSPYTFSTPHPYSSVAAYTSAAYQSYYQSYLASMSNLTPGEIQARAALYTQGRVPYGQGITAGATSYSYANYFTPTFPAVTATSSVPLPTPTAATPAPTTPVTPLPSTISNTKPATVPPSTTPNTSNVAPDTPFPVSIPATELNSLHRLGIYPVATSSLPPNTPEPAAVFIGLSADGSMINMTINLAKLEPSQRGGLAKFLSGLVKNDKGGASAG